MDKKKIKNKGMILWVCVCLYVKKKLSEDVKMN